VWVLSYVANTVFTIVLVEAYGDYIRRVGEAQDSGLPEPTFSLHPGGLVNLRSDPARGARFRLMASLFYPTMYGRTKWKKLVDTAPFSEFFHASSEAFVLLVIENNFDYWLRWMELRYALIFWFRHWHANCSLRLTYFFEVMTQQNRTQEKKRGTPGVSSQNGLLGLVEMVLRLQFHGRRKVACGTWRSTHIL
jgi:hypothetical protein